MGADIAHRLLQRSETLLQGPDAARRHRGSTTFTHCPQNNSCRLMRIHPMSCAGYARTVRKQLRHHVVCVMQDRDFVQYSSTYCLFCHARRHLKSTNAVWSSTHPAMAASCS